MVYEKQSWLDGVSGGTPLSAARLNKMEQGIMDAHTLQQAVADGMDYMNVIWLDSMVPNGSDDDKLDAAIALQKSEPHRTIVASCRTYNVNKPRLAYPALKLVGNNGLMTGQQNPEIAGGAYVGTRFVLGTSISSGTSSWWNWSSGNLFNTFLASFSLAGRSGTSQSQFFDTAGGTLYSCQFHCISADFMRGVYGRADRKFLATQVTWSGMSTWNNAHDCQIFAGGSDCKMFLDNLVNIGVSQDVSQVGDINRYFVKFDGLEASVGKLYISTMNGWRGMLIDGACNLDMFGTIIEGYKPTRVNGLLAGPGPGRQVVMNNGAVSMTGVKIGQGLDNPSTGEISLLRLAGGELTMQGCEFYGSGMDQANKNAIEQVAGRLNASGILRRVDEKTGSPQSYAGAKWSGRPRIVTPFTANTSDNSYSCSDFSLQAA